MGHRYWLERGFYCLPSQRLYDVHQVIWSLRTPADLHRVIAYLKGNSGAHARVQEDARTRDEKMEPAD